MTIRIPVLAALLLLGAAPSRAQPFPVLGGYGFDWLKPDTASCRPISRREAERFQACRFEPSGNAFGLPSSHHSCKAPGRSETLVYETRAQCEAALETMRANAP
ncbi:hypothetical protein NZK32_18280 [Cyanobium sp. FGCU-52]|nr:hypothetical protein [Cyanobium sp. FGCU52]